jgi:hypothetical protein
MSCSGLHCAGCGSGGAAPVLVLAALEGGAWVAAHLIEVAAVSAACAVLAFAAVAALVRWGDRRDARQLAGPPLMVTRPDAAPLPPPVRRELPPVVSNYFYVEDGPAVRVIRQALPGRSEP